MIHMKRRVITAIILIFIFIIGLSVIKSRVGGAPVSSTLVANTIMGYDYGNVDLKPVLLSNSTLRFKATAVYNWWLTRHTDDLKFNVTKMYEDNVSNPEIVLDTVKKGWDDRLSLRGSDYLINVKDLRAGLDYILYDSKLIKLDTSSFPEVFSVTRGNPAYRYILVEVTNGTDDATGLPYKEFHYNKEQGMYGVGIRILYKDNKLVDYRIL